MPRAPKKATSRPRKKGDDSTNARKRYYRAAERNLAKAEKSSGATAARYRQLARQNFEDALSTYDPANTQKVSKPIQKLADQFNIDISEYQQLRQQAFKSTDIRIREQAESKQRLSIWRSQNVLESNLKDEQFRTELEAREIFNSPIGSRIIGGLVDVWRDAATDANGKVDRSKIFSAIQDYFGVDNLADLLDKVEEKIGDELYKDPGNLEIYDVITILLQTKIADNTLVD